MPESARLFAALQSAEPLAVAVSGGSDSMALLRLLAGWSGPRRLTALTVDHGLRDGSAGEAAQVGRWCAALAIPHEVLPWQGEKPRTGIQAKARTARYDAMTAWCAERGVPVLVTAHTLNDQAETVAMRQRRTQSVQSLAGIWPETQWRGTRIVRPLLGVTRCALRAYLRSLGQPWLDDPSNSNTDFERVRIRRSLRQADIARLGAIASQSQQLARAQESHVGTWLRDHATIHAAGMISVPAAEAHRLSREERVAVLSRLICACGSATRPERADVERIALHVEAGGPFRMTLGGAIVAGRTRLILVGREAGRMAKAEQTIPQSGQLLWDGRFQITAPPGFVVRPAGGLHPPRPTGLPDFVRAALPVLSGDGEGPFFPHFSSSGRALVTLGERFRL